MESTAAGRAGVLSVRIGVGLIAEVTDKCRKGVGEPVIGCPGLDVELSVTVGCRRFSLEPGELAQGCGCLARAPRIKYPQATGKAQEPSADHES